MAPVRLKFWNMQTTPRKYGPYQEFEVDPHSVPPLKHGRDQDYELEEGCDPHCEREEASKADDGVKEYDSIDKTVTAHFDSCGIGPLRSE